MYTCSLRIVRCIDLFPWLRQETYHVVPNLASTDNVTVQCIAHLLSKEFLCCVSDRYMTVHQRRELHKYLWATRFCVRCSWICCVSIELYNVYWTLPHQLSGLLIWKASIIAKEFKWCMLQTDGAICTLYFVSVLSLRSVWRHQLSRLFSTSRSCAVFRLPSIRMKNY